MKVQFPGLWGLEYNINTWAFQIFGVKIFWYGIIIALGFLAAVLLATRSCKNYDIKQDDILDLVLFTAPAAIIGARLYYVLFSWSTFKDNLWEIFQTRNGGLAVYGGIIGAFIVAWFFAKKKKIPFLHLLDFGVPYLALGQAIGRWGNFVNHEAFGIMTTLPWRMNGDVYNEYLAGLSQNVDLAKAGVHPTFLYESLLDFAIFLFLAAYRKKKKVTGEVLFLYLILYGAGRFLIEGLRTDSLMVGMNTRVSQMLSLLLVLVFIVLFIYIRFKKNKAEDEAPVDLGQSQYGSVLLKMKEQEKAEAEGKAMQHLSTEKDNEGSSFKNEEVHSDTEQGKTGDAEEESAEEKE
jgi:phosphatidylglycerol:prolipoprotein diacylglycerol transferase